MKIKILFLLLFCFVATHLPAAPLGTAFTYQGYLSGAGAAASGNFDLQFSLYDAANNGNQVGPTVTNLDVAVNNGLFLVTLDFGNVFNGNARWLALGVRTNGNANGGFTALLPLQPLNPTPYALYATNAGAASNVLSGSISAAQLSTPAGSPAPGQVLGYNGTNLVWTSASGGAGSTNSWNLTGNTGTTAGVNFLGTTDFRTMEIHVSGVRGWQLLPTFDTPSLVAGAPGNFVPQLVQGATIAGGGTITTYGHPYSNSVFAYHGTIGGGLGNTIQSNAYESTIAGGNQNTIVANDSAVGGGYSNSTQAKYSTIGGGNINTIAIAQGSTIAGGEQNSIQTDAFDSAIGGGTLNNIQGDASYSVIAGGEQNIIQNGAGNSTIAGGFANLIQAGSFYSTIAGGGQNTIQVSADESTIAGGYNNNIQSGAPGSAILGGLQNVILATNSVIGGGLQNNIQSVAFNSFIGGGFSNIVQTSAPYGTIGGGYNNTIQSGSPIFVFGLLVGYNGTSSTIGGGQFNTIQSNATSSAIGGGQANTVTGTYGTIPGGLNNVANSGSFAAGQFAQATNFNSFVWSDGSVEPTTSTADDQFLVRANGGVIFYSGQNNSAGVQLLHNASSWTTLSDRNAKKNISPLDYQAVLEKLAKVPISQWNYKWEKDTDVPNIGPMAQDFKAAFYPGRDDKGITTLEFDGVELAAIQGLNQKLAEQDQRLKSAMEQKDARIAQLEKELAAVKSAQDRTMAEWEARFESLRKDLARLENKSARPLETASQNGR